jgi:hypothetical protein
VKITKRNGEMACDLALICEGRSAVKGRGAGGVSLIYPCFVMGAWYLDRPAASGSLGLSQLKAVAAGAAKG